MNVIPDYEPYIAAAYGLAALLPGLLLAFCYAAYRRAKTTAEALMREDRA